MKSQLSLIISFQVETSLTIVLFLLLSSYYYTTMISAEQGENTVSDVLTNMPGSRGVGLRKWCMAVVLYLFLSLSGFSCFFCINISPKMSRPLCFLHSWLLQKWQLFLGKIKQKKATKFNLNLKLFLI